MGQCNSTNSNKKPKCVLCNDTIENDYISCGKCDSNFHRCCYESSLNEYGESNRNSKFTTCPNEFCREIGVCYTNSLNHPINNVYNNTLHSIHTVQRIPLAHAEIINV